MTLNPCMSINRPKVVSPFPRFLVFLRPSWLDQKLGVLLGQFLTPPVYGWSLLRFYAPWEVCGFRVTATTRCPTHCHFCVIFVALKAPWVHAPQLDPPGALGPRFSTSRGPSKSREIRCMNFEWIFSPPPTSVCMNFSPLQMTHKIQVSRRGEKFIPGGEKFMRNSFQNSCQNSFKIHSKIHSKGWKIHSGVGEFHHLPIFWKENHWSSTCASSVQKRDRPPHGDIEQFLWF